MAAFGDTHKYRRSTDKQINKKGQGWEYIKGTQGPTERADLGQCWAPLSNKINNVVLDKNPKYKIITKSPTDINKYVSKLKSKEKPITLVFNFQIIHVVTSCLRRCRIPPCPLMVDWAW
jgi:hypothetical protein